MNATNYRIRLNVFSHYSACGYYYSITNGYSCQDCCIGSYPYVLTDMDGSIDEHPFTNDRVLTTISMERRNNASCDN